jgi:hypothetical protein
LRIVQVLEANGWDRLEIEELRGREPAMACDQLACPIDHERADEAEGANGRGDLLDLAFGVRSRVSRIALQACERDILDGELEVYMKRQKGVFRLPRTTTTSPA